MEPAAAADIPTPKRFREGTHRATAPDETVRRLAPLLPGFGVTRVADVTGLDYVGIPVCMAVRPDSRNLSVLQGKGSSLAAAKASAIMEAVESFCADQPSETTEFGPLERESDARFLLPRNLLRRDPEAGAGVPWVEGIDLFSGRAMLVPEELVRVDFSLPPPAGYGWFLSGSNGLAAGNTRAEALLHAICELIERDASALWHCRGAAARRVGRIDPSGVSDPTVGSQFGRLLDAGMGVMVWDITTDIGAPCFRCVIDDANARRPFLGRFGGSGCHPSTAVALSRALAEAAQSRLTAIVGARDDLPPSHYAMIGWDRHASSLFGEAPPPSAATPASLPPASLPPSLDRATIDADLSLVLERLLSAGIRRLVAVDLSQFGVPCFRVIADGLEGQHDKRGYRPGRRAQRRRRVRD